MRCLTLFFATFFATAVSAATPREVTVTGDCQRNAVPDRGAITVTAEYTEKSVSDAVSRATTAYERVRDAVKRLELADAELQTSEYSVNEVREWTKDKYISRGFKARMGLKITSSNIEKLGEVTAIAAREGIRDVGSLATFLSREKARSEQMACLADASAHARAKAEKLAGALGAKLGEVTSISESGATPVHPMPMMAMAEMKSARASAPVIEAGQQEISISIQASFALK